LFWFALVRLLLSLDPFCLFQICVHKFFVLDPLTTPLSPSVEPSFLRITSIPQVPKVERLLVLCCRVENFYPQDISLEWSRNDGEQVHNVTHFGPFSNHNSLYSVWSKIQLVMAQEDESAVYICRVYHSSFAAPGFKDVSYYINTQGLPQWLVKTHLTLTLQNNVNVMLTNKYFSFIQFRTMKIVRKLAWKR
uniref:Ig-like domain-containing protein n=1 Tax=Echeneis naucrates TaxID=173247 RepID=A0A665VC65_ECHNA